MGTGLKPIVEHHDLRGQSGRALVVGDIHGCFGLLRDALAAVDYDPAVDRLFLLGDLIDRGPESRDFAQWLHLPRVLGNHEAMCADAVNDPHAADFHRRNGGGWFDALEGAARSRAAARLTNAPVAIELVTPAGYRVGLVHADVEGGDWPAFLGRLATGGPMSRAAETALWGRARLRDAVPGTASPATTIAGIDHVFFGHSVVAEPMTAGNCSWIDTGSSFSGKLCVIDIDAWLASGIASAEFSGAVAAESIA